MKGNIMKAVIELLTTIYVSIKEDYKSIVKRLLDLDVYDFQYVSKSNKDNIVVVLKSELDAVELDKLQASLKDTGFTLSYLNNLDKNSNPIKILVDNESVDKSPLMILHSDSSSIDDFLDC